MISVKAQKVNSKQHLLSPPTFLLIEDTVELAELANGNQLNININTRNLLMGLFRKVGTCIE